MENIIIEAIKEKKVITVDATRIVEPHIYEINDGVVQLFGYQIRRGSNNGVILDWRRFKLSTIQNLQILNKSFLGRRSFSSSEHSHWEKQILVVE